jgi:hypothetical protein
MRQRHEAQRKQVLGADLFGTLFSKRILSHAAARTRSIGNFARQTVQAFPGFDAGQSVAHCQARLRRRGSLANGRSLALIQVSPAPRSVCK